MWEKFLLLSINENLLKTAESFFKTVKKYVMEKPTGKDRGRDRNDVPEGNGIEDVALTITDIVQFSIDKEWFHVRTVESEVYSNTTNACFNQDM